jgi:segregation and condensation protein A
MTDEYRVQLDMYNGPLELLLFLIRREEVDIYDIPIVKITEQYVAYVELLQQIDPNAAGEFLVLAAMLMEIKSRMLLPRPPAETEEEFVDPRLELVRQLLEYKKFKDAADQLRVAANEQAQRYPRQPAEIDDGSKDHLDIDSLQMWDLVEAFRVVMEKVGRLKPHEIQYDDTPISLHAADVVDRLQREGGSMEFGAIFEGRTRSECIGLFLSLLELVRQRRVRVEQDAPFGSIFIHLLDDTPIEEPERISLPFGTEVGGSETDEEPVESGGSDSRDRAVGDVGEELQTGVPEESDDDFTDMPEIPEVAELPPNWAESGEPPERPTSPSDPE